MRLQFVLHAHFHRVGTQEESTLTSRSIALAVCSTGICFLQKARAAVCLLAFALSPSNQKRGRIGLELGYTGRQALTGDPYRSVSEPYFEVNVLGEIRFGGISIFLNAINLTNVRQTRFDPLIRPAPGPRDNPITDVSAPLEGRSFNPGIRAEL